MAPQIAVVVVHWNSGPDTLRCLASVRASQYAAHELIVVDNGSRDGSAAALQAASPGLTLVRSPVNLGFAGGNNLGLRIGLERGADYVFLLNNDAVVEPATLGALAEAARARPAAGFIGARILALEAPGVVLSAGGRLVAGWRPAHVEMGAQDGAQAAQPVPVDYLSGAALLVSRRAVEQVGPLDEDFFLYYEDVEWCWRARQAGFEVLVAPAARVYHPDTRARDENSVRVTYYTARNSLLFAKKRRLGYAVLLRLWLEHGRLLLSWSLQPRWRHKRPQRNALARGLRDFALGRRGPAAGL